MPYALHHRTTLMCRQYRPISPRPLRVYKVMLSHSSATQRSRRYFDKFDFSVREFTCVFAIRHRFLEIFFTPAVKCKCPFASPEMNRDELAGLVVSVAAMWTGLNFSYRLHNGAGAILPSVTSHLHASKPARDADSIPDTYILDVLTFCLLRCR